MRISSLEAYNTPPQLIAVWEKTYGSHLLPVQETAVAQHRVLAGRNLIVQAPTSAGKTFIGEMAATRAALAGRKVLYLVPTKALAEDKFAHFSSLYQPLGLRIIVITRDRREDDHRFTSGDFDIAIAIPEKVRALWARHGVSQFLGLAVLDELQTMTEPQRGPCLELLLAELRRLPALQIVGLSACLGASPRLADYLDADWLETAERPLELRKGVLVSDCFRYLDAHGQLVEEVFEGVGPQAGDRPGEAVARLALHFARLQEPTIIFVRDRGTALRLALTVAERMDNEASRQAPAGLAGLERTAVREQLATLMARGVAFHSADLQFEDRRAVETAFGNGDIRVLCSTPTLALGINLPARNVIIDPHGWQSELAGSPSALSPISRSDFENRAGRAGRIGSGAFGRGILIADTDLAAQTYQARYLDSAFSPPEPALANLPPLQAALTIAAGAAIRHTSLDDVYAGTYTAYLLRHTHLPEPVTQAAERCLESGLLRRDGQGLVPTSLGQQAAVSGVSFETFCMLSEAAANLPLPGDLEATLLVAMTTEAREAGSCGGMGRSDYAEALRRYAAQTDQEGPWLDALLADQRYDWRLRERAAWMTLALVRWMGREDTYEVEQAVRLAAARLMNLGETAGWLVETLADIATDRGCKAADAARLRRHAQCLAHGLEPAGLPLARLRCPGLGRDHIRALLQADINDTAAVMAAGREGLMKILPELLAGNLMRAALRVGPDVPDGYRVGVSRRDTLSLDVSRGTADPRAENSGGAAEPADSDGQPALVLSSDQPHQAFFFGCRVPLRPAEFRLLRALAEKAGKCVSHSALYNRIWGGEPLAEPGQIYAHRSRLCGKLAAALPGHDIKQIVMTIPKHGLMLNLRPQEVQLS